MQRYRGGGSMKTTLIIDLDLDSGDYGLEINTDDGEAVDAMLLSEILFRGLCMSLPCFREVAESVDAPEYEADSDVTDGEDFDA